MKVIANLGKIDKTHSALIIDNEHFPYYIVNGYNGETEGEDLWVNTTKYYDNLFDFARAITNFTEGKIGYDRMSEIASKAIDGLIEDDAYEAEIYLKEEIEMELDEAIYFGVGEMLDMVKGYEEDEDYDD